MSQMVSFALPAVSRSAEQVAPLWPAWSQDYSGNYYGYDTGFQSPLVYDGELAPVIIGGRSDLDVPTPATFGYDCVLSSLSRKVWSRRAPLVEMAKFLAAKEGQQLFRVVNNAERAGIEGSGRFTMPSLGGSTPTGQPGKFFWGSLDEAKQFQQIWYRGGEQSHILQTTIGSEVKPWLGPPLTDGIGQPIFVELPNLTAPIQWVH